MIDWVSERVRRRWREQPSLSEQDVALAIRPSLGRVIALGAVGLSADYSHPSYEELLERRLRDFKFIEMRDAH